MVLTWRVAVSLENHNFVQEYGVFVSNFGDENRGFCDFSRWYFAFPTSGCFSPNWDEFGCCLKRFIHA